MGIDWRNGGKGWGKLGAIDCEELAVNCCILSWECGAGRITGGGGIVPWEVSVKIKEIITKWKKSNIKWK